ncbi:hypothetical protein [Nostoc sp. FACHB-133]|nr:hypothetical protein [Nostoc sp. FACHB-133]
MKQFQRFHQCFTVFHDPETAFPSVKHETPDNSLLESRYEG